MHEHAFVGDDHEVGVEVLDREVERATCDPGVRHQTARDQQVAVCGEDGVALVEVLGPSDSTISDIPERVILRAGTTPPSTSKSTITSSCTHTCDTLCAPRSPVTGSSARTSSPTATSSIALVDPSAITTAVAPAKEQASPGLIFPLRIGFLLVVTRGSADAFGLSAFTVLLTMLRTAGGGHVDAAALKALDANGANRFHPHRQSTNQSHRPQHRIRRTRQRSNTPPGCRCHT